MVTQKLVVKNLDSEADKKRVDEVLHDVWGVRQVAIDLKTKEVLVSYNENAASFIDFQQAIIDSGFDIINPNDAVKQDIE